ncbi:LacI family DNA-binding transcriptional regulator [Hymenobacter humi]
MANRRASITDLAKTLGLSPSTISRALSDHDDVSEATKARVRQAGRRAALPAQPGGRRPAPRPQQHAGRARAAHHGALFPQVVHGIATEAAKLGFNVMICQSNEDSTQEHKNIDLLMNSQVEGILVSLANSTHDFGHFEAVRQQNIPLVFFDRVVEDFEGSNVSAVVLDDYQGAYQVVTHLIEQGCTRVAHFSGPLHLNIHKNRHQGYRDALTSHGLTVDEDLIVFCEMNQKGGMQAMRQPAEVAPAPRRPVFVQRPRGRGRPASGQDPSAARAAGPGHCGLQQRDVHHPHRAHAEQRGPALRANGQNGGAAAAKDAEKWPQPRGPAQTHRAQAQAAGARVLAAPVKSGRQNEVETQHFASRR